MSAEGAGLCLGRVYDDNFRYVWRCLRSLGVRSDQLDDAAQEVFIVVQEKLSSFDGAAHVRSWLYAIALRVARRARRAAAIDAQRFLRPSRDGETEDPSPHTDQHGPNSDLRLEIESNEQLALAQRALDALDETKREVFVLACIEGMSAPELVGILGIPLNTVYSRIRAARLAFLAAARDLETQKPRDLPHSPPAERLIPQGTR